MADAAAQDDRDLTDTEQAQIGAMATRCAEIDGQLTTYAGQLDSQRAYATLRQRLTEADEADGRRLDEDARPGGMQRRDVAGAVDWGRTFVESAQFREYHGYGRSNPVELPMELRAPIDTTGVLIPTSTHNPVYPAVATPFLDVCGGERTSSGAVEYLYWTPPDPQASVVPEGTPKPEANIPSEVKTEALLTYAHWKGITRQALEDYPRVESIVRGKLENGLRLAVESAAATTVLADGGIPPTTGPDLLGSIRNGVATVQTNGYQPSAVLLNPGDWAEIDLAVMGGTLLGPSGASSFWSLRPIASAAIPIGHAFVGDFANGVTVFDRGQANVFMTDSHGDLFISNVVVILAETRALPAVTTPAAMTECTVVAGP
jgi:HK97 family phage major capsid protein